MSKRWVKRPPGSNWGEWGPEDQLGRLNLVTEVQVLKGASEIKTGKTFCLSLPLNYPGGQVINTVRHPPNLRPIIRNSVPYYNYKWNKNNPHHMDIGSDDYVVLYNQYSTHWDSLAHRGSFFDVDGDGERKAVYYNGFHAEEDIVMKEENKTSAEKLGIEHMAEHGVQGRGVLIDLYSKFGEFPRKEVGYDDLMRIMEKNNIIVEQGDLLCLWTGLDRMIMRKKGKPNESLKNACAVLDGWDSHLLNWITDSGIAAIASDNLAIEALGKQLPKGHIGSTLPLHEHCLFKLGIHLGELWYLEKLAQWLKKQNRFRFMLSAPPLRLTGAVGSPVTPIAIV